MEIDEQKFGQSVRVVGFILTNNPYINTSSQCSAYINIHICIRTIKLQINLLPTTLYYPFNNNYIPEWSYYAVMLHKQYILICRTSSAKINNGETKRKMLQHPRKPHRTVQLAKHMNHD